MLAPRSVALVPSVTEHSLARHSHMSRHPFYILSPRGEKALSRSFSLRDSHVACLTMEINKTETCLTPPCVLLGYWAKEMVKEA